MSEIATTPGAAMAEALDTVRTATVPALVGLIGAVASLPISDMGLPPFFLAASLPMSVLGLALGFHQRNAVAILLGATGIAFATAGLFLG